MQKVAVITGGAKRIGAAIAKYLHAKDFLIVIHYHESITEAQKISDFLNSKRAASSILIKANLSVEKDISNLVALSLDFAGRLDVVVNNTSIFSKDNADFAKMFKLNVQAPFLLSNLVYPHLQAVKGVIVNITDTHAHRPLREYSAYCQTKAALSMQTKSLAVEFAPDVRVNAVAPGAILWPEGDNSLSKGKKQTIISNTPLKRHGDPKYVAKAVFSLIENEFITGQEVVVDGGRNI